MHSQSMETKRQRGGVGVKPPHRNVITLLGPLVARTKADKARGMAW